MKKNLLNESEIRKFMKFANLRSLTENFVDNLEEDDWPATGLEEADFTPEEEVPAEESADELAADELAADEPADELADEPGTVAFSLSAEQAAIVSPMFAQLADAVEEQAGLTTDDGEEEVPEMDALPPSPDTRPSEEEELDEAGIYLQESREERQTRIVNEVSNRVAKRLLQTSRARKR